MWQTVLEIDKNKGGPMMWRGNVFSGRDFCVIEPYSAVKQELKDSLPDKHNSGIYDLCLLGNRAADTFYIISFSPKTVFSHGDYPFKIDSNETGNDTAVYFRIQLFQYASYLKPIETERLNAIVKQQFYFSIHASNRKEDTLYSNTFFSASSQTVLAQAPIHVLIDDLKYGMLSGDLHVYSDSLLHIGMRSYDIQGSWITWDSTNQVEDPNNPGTFILAPIKIEDKGAGIILYEKWIPFVQATYFNWVQPTMGYTRKLLAYGIKLNRGSTLWLDANEVDKFLASSKFNMIPYEETFRSERFRTMKIQVY
jgi:hypothetical protein